LPRGGRDAAGFVIQKQAAAIGEEVDAISAKIEAQVADVDVIEALFAGFHGEGLTFGFDPEPFVNARQEAALFCGEAGLLPWVSRGGAESGVEGGIDLGGEDAGKCFCSDGVRKIVAVANGPRASRGKETKHDIVEQAALCAGAEPPFRVFERRGTETLCGKGLKRAGSLALEDIGAAGVLFMRPRQCAGIVGDCIE